MEGGVVGQYYETLYFCHRHRHPPSWNAPLKWVGLTISAPVSDISFPACTNGVWPLWPVSVAQKNKPSTVLSSNVKSINLMQCTA